MNDDLPYDKKSKRRRELTCRVCSKPMFKRKTSLPQGEAACRECRTADKSVRAHRSGTRKNKNSQPMLMAADKCQFVVDGARKGWDAERITVAWYGHRNAFEQKRVQHMLDVGVEVYDTYIDEVAIERAYRGDKTVFDAMTHWEKRALVDRVVDAMRKRSINPGYPGYHATAPGSQRDGWVQMLSEDLTGEGDYYRRIANKRDSVKRDHSAKA